MTLSFLLTTLIVVASPSTGVLYTLAVALTQGARPSLAAAFGCTLGDRTANAGGDAGPGRGAAHQRAGVRGAEIWRRGLPALYGLAGAARDRSSRRVIVTAILFNILNPKLSIFFLAFLPQFIAAEEAHTLAPHA